MISCNIIIRKRHKHEDASISWMVCMNDYIRNCVKADYDVIQQKQSVIGSTGMRTENLTEFDSGKCRKGPAPQTAWHVQKQRL
jgi:hypothetical protein